MRISYPDALPVSRQRDEIAKAIREHQVVIVCGDTGSGKTTQLPKIALEAAGKQNRGRIGCTQPRRIAATSVAKRVAEETQTQLGREVGYQIRFEDKTDKKTTAIKFMTDGILLAETRGDPKLSQYSTIIVDEAHERSLNIDFILGYLHRLLPKRPDLKVILSSATLDAEGFANFFVGAPIIHVEGRTFPVTDEYLPPESSREPIPDHVARACELLGKTDPLGDTLVFLPGEGEIRACADLLAGRNYPRTVVLPLFARMAGAEQQKVFQPNPHKRRIVLATNVAETSLTIPDIRSVIDTGVARVNRFDATSGIQRLQIEKISQASARQRRGRCGRVSEGLCVRLYEEEDFDARRPFTDPEILRTNLAGVVLQMEHLGLGDPLDFPFVDKPQPKRVTQAYRTLEEIGALNPSKKQRRGALTEIGRTLARLPLDPRVGRILIAAEKENCLREGIVVAAALSVQDPRERPADKQAAADQAHAKFRDKTSDFTGWLRLWHGLDKERRAAKSSNNALRRFGKKNFVNFRRAQEWINLHREIRSVLREMRWKLPDEKRPMSDPEGSYSEALHRAILTAIPSHIGYHEGRKKGYRGARDRTFFLHPGSGIFGSSPGWVMAFEVIETARLYARNASSVNPEWLEDVAPHLIRYRNSNAQWDPDQGAVYGEQRITAFGLVLNEGRPVHYGRIDLKTAREIFIHEALVNANTKAPLAALAQHRDIIGRAERLEHKLRRRDGLLMPESIYAFYHEQIPHDICTQKYFERWARENTAPFDLALEDCIVPQLEPVTDATYPDAIATPGGASEFPLTYLHAPFDEADGITATVPLADLGHLPDWFGSWLVEGWLREKTELILRCLPKDTRRRLPSVTSVTDDFLASWDGYVPECGLLDALINHLDEHHEVEVFASTFDLDRIPDHLEMRFSIVDDNGEEIASSRDLSSLQENLASKIAKRFSGIAKQNPFHRDHISKWDFGDLPFTTELDAHTNGYAALCEGADGKPTLRVFESEEDAHWHHPAGLALLYCQIESDRIQRLKNSFGQGSARPTPKKQKPTPTAQPDSGFSLAAAFGDTSTPPPSPTTPSPISHLPSSSALLTTADLLHLKTLGSEPHRNVTDLLTLIAMEALHTTCEGELPRTAEEFASAREAMRGELHATAERVCSQLREILNASLSILPNLSSPQSVYADSLDDARYHWERITAAGWLAHLRPGELRHIARTAKSIDIRLTRMLGAPATKDEAKMHRLWDALPEPETPPNSTCPCNSHHPSPVELSELHHEHTLRIQHFAPELK